MKNVLFINPFGIGDVLFTTPLVHTLKESFPENRVGYLVNKRSASVLRDNPYVDSVFIYDRDEFEKLRRSSTLEWAKKAFLLLRAIQKEHYNLALDFSLNTQYGFLSWLAGIKERAGFDYKKRGMFLTRKISLDGFVNAHMVEQYASLLRMVGIEPSYRKPEVYLNRLAQNKADALLSGSGIKEGDILVGLLPGGGRSWGKDARVKQWPPERFGQLADKIIENYHAKIIIMGDSEEEMLAKKVKENIRYGALDCTGKTSVVELAALIKRTCLLVCNDGGPLHIAVGLGVKTVSLFGPVDDAVYGPYPPSGMHIVMKSQMPCRPCYRNFRLSRICTQGSDCLQEIGVEDVFENVKKLL
ncbi:MAG: glycosyltransferase family 9 protein [Candidatus Omnitrophota bacterium]|nr:MAG: glycosyltransferase family 9 protein [Candidatus Omnitrophota bacterium]